VAHSKLLHSEITDGVIQAAIKVHRQLGPGLLESTYEACLHHALAQPSFAVRRQSELPVVFDGVTIDCGYRLDLIVEDRVVVEVKAVEKLLPIHEAQLLTYLKLSGMRVGLLINFNVEILKHRLRRRVL